MKYIITAKGGVDVNSGTGSFVEGTPISQTESATELIINRLAAICYLKEGIIDSNTIVVTLSDRKFLYENIFKNIEVYDPNKKYEDVIDLVTEEKLSELCKTLPYKPFYKNFERDKKELLNIKYNEDILNQVLPNFLVCIPRLKNSDTRRNLDQNYWRDFIKCAKFTYEKIFVFGKGNENLADEHIIYIDTFQDYCSYIHHPNCIDIVSTISGPCHYAQSFGNSTCNSKMTMIDNIKLINKHGDDPSYFHPCMNFTQIPIKYINEIPEVEDLLRFLKS